MSVTTCSSAQVVDLSTGLMEKLNIKMGCWEKEDNSVLISHQVSTLHANAFNLTNIPHQVGPGEGVVNLRASAAPLLGLKLNSEAKSSWKLTVDAVQVALVLFHPLPFHDLTSN